jgi:hypothetical protein
MNLIERRPIVFTALSRHLFYARMLICKFVLLNDAVPLNPFTAWGYFLDDLVDRDLVRRANNNMIMNAEELWAFGPVSNGVLFEIELAIQLGKTVRFFSAGPRCEDILPLHPHGIEFEADVVATCDCAALINKILQHDAERSSDSIKLRGES